MLQIKDLNVYYGGIHALRDINIEVNEGEIVTLIGANGAGKTSTLRAISGLTPYKTGDITFKGQSMKNIPPHQIVAQGLSQVPEGRKIFANLTVMENLELGAYLRKDKNNLQGDYDKIFQRFPRLGERKKQLALGTKDVWSHLTDFRSILLSSGIYFVIFE